MTGLFHIDLNLLRQHRWIRKDNGVWFQRKNSWELLTVKPKRKIPLAQLLLAAIRLEFHAHPQRGVCRAVPLAAKPGRGIGFGIWCHRRGTLGCTYCSRTFIFSPFLKDKSSGWMPSYGYNAITMSPCSSGSENEQGERRPLRIHSRIFKMDNQQGLTVWQGNSAQCHVASLEGRRVLGRMDTCIHG